MQLILIAPSLVQSCIRDKRPCIRDKRPVTGTGAIKLIARAIKLIARAIKLIAPSLLRPPPVPVTGPLNCTGSWYRAVSGTNGPVSASGKTVQQEPVIKFNCTPECSNSRLGQKFQKFRVDEFSKKIFFFFSKNGWGGVEISKTSCKTGPKGDIFEIFENYPEGVRKVGGGIFGGSAGFSAQIFPTGNFGKKRVRFCQNYQGRGLGKIQNLR